MFFHANFLFKNGETSEKYLILLNTPNKGEPHLILKTTSQRKEKPVTPGCIRDWQVYFIPAKKSWFRIDTWVQLYEIYEEPALDKASGYRKKDSLPSKMMDDIIKCLFDSCEDDITEYQKALLKPAWSTQIDKLREHFGKGRK